MRRDRGVDVSILTGPLRPVLRGYTAINMTSRHCFNPHRPVKAGASPSRDLGSIDLAAVSILTGPLRPVLRRPPDTALRATRRRFNPHRPVKAGASRPFLYEFGFAPFVSILTGPLRPVLHYSWGHDPHTTQGFNPHRPVKAGASSSSSCCFLPLSWFQSSPAR